MPQQTAAVVRAEEPALTPFQVIESVITNGDLAKMTPQERVAFYWRTCESLGLNPLTRPFEFHNLNGKIVMYAKKDATDQLRALRGVTITEIRREKDADLGLLTVYARGRDKAGREDESTGVVNVKGLGGEALANAVMKAETKAKRRLTLSLVGLGFLDESEIEGAAPAVDPETGELVEQQAKPTLLEAVERQRARMTAATETPATSRPAAGAATSDSGADIDATGGADDSSVAHSSSAPVEGSFIEVDEPAPAEIRSLTVDQLKAWLAEHRIAGDYAGQVAKQLWPDAKSAADLTDEQRGQLARELLGPDAGGS